jgi:hypothetical protein
MLAVGLAKVKSRSSIASRCSVVRFIKSRFPTYLQPMDSNLLNLGGKKRTAKKKQGSKPRMQELTRSGGPAIA